MDFDEFIASMAEAFPGSGWGIEEDGEIVIFTGMTTDTVTGDVVEMVT